MCFDSDFIVLNSTFSDNSATSGGAFTASKGSNGLLEGLTFQSNVAFEQVS